jgi:hypothetical protein
MDMISNCELKINMTDEVTVTYTNSNGEIHSIQFPSLQTLVAVFVQMRKNMDESDVMDLINYSHARAHFETEQDWNEMIRHWASK